MADPFLTSLRDAFAADQTAAAARPAPPAVMYSPAPKLYGMTRDGGLSLALAQAANSPSVVPNEPWAMPYDNAIVAAAKPAPTAPARATAPARTTPAQEDTGGGGTPTVKYMLPEDNGAGDLADRLAKAGISLGSMIKLMSVLPHTPPPMRPVRTPFADDAGRLAAAAAKSAYDEVWADPKASVDQKRKARESYINTMSGLVHGGPQAATIADLIGQ